MGGGEAGSVVASHVRVHRVTIGEIGFGLGGDSAGASVFQSSVFLRVLMVPISDKRSNTNLPSLFAASITQGEASISFGELMGGVYHAVPALSPAWLTGQATRNIPSNHAVPAFSPATLADPVTSLLHSGKQEPVTTPIARQILHLHRARWLRVVLAGNGYDAFVESLRCGAVALEVALKRGAGRGAVRLGANRAAEMLVPGPGGLQVGGFANRRRGRTVVAAGHRHPGRGECGETLLAHRAVVVIKNRFGDAAELIIHKAAQPAGETATTERDEFIAANLRRAVLVDGLTTIIARRAKIRAAAVSPLADQTARAIACSEQVAIQIRIALAGAVGEGGWPLHGGLAGNHRAGNRFEIARAAACLAREVTETDHAAGVVAHTAELAIAIITEVQALAELAADAGNVAVGRVDAGERDAIRINDLRQCARTRGGIEGIENPPAVIGKSQRQRLRHRNDATHRQAIGRERTIRRDLQHVDTAIAFAKHDSREHGGLQWIIMQRLRDDVIRMVPSVAQARA